MFPCPFPPFHKRSNSLHFKVLLTHKKRALGKASAHGKEGCRYCLKVESKDRVSCSWCDYCGHPYCRFCLFVRILCFCTFCVLTASYYFHTHTHTHTHTIHTSNNVTHTTLRCAVPVSIEVHPQYKHIHTLSNTKTSSLVGERPFETQDRSINRSLKGS